MLLKAAWPLGAEITDHTRIRFPIVVHAHVGCQELPLVRRVGAPVACEGGRRGVHAHVCLKFANARSREVTLLANERVHDAMHLHNERAKRAL